MSTSSRGSAPPVQKRVLAIGLSGGDCTDMFRCRRVPCFSDRRICCVRIFVCCPGAAPDAFVPRLEMELTRAWSAASIGKRDLLMHAVPIVKPGLVSLDFTVHSSCSKLTGLVRQEKDRVCCANNNTLVPVPDEARLDGGMIRNPGAP